MKNNLLILLLLSISFSAYSKDKSCFELLSAVLKTKSPKLKSDKNFINNYIKKLNLKAISSEASLALQKNFSSSKDILDKRKFESYLFFLDSQLEKNQSEIAKLGDDIFKKATSKNKYLKRFLKHDKQIRKFSKKNLDKIKNDIKKENVNISERELISLAYKQQHEFFSKYQRVYYGCHAPKWTEERKNAGNAFKKFTLGIGAISGVAAYSYQNWDKEKDGAWFGKIGYEVVWSVLKGFIGAKIISNPSNSTMAKALKKYLLARGTGLIDMGIYGYLFSADHDKAEKIAKDILNDPIKREEVKKLKKYLEVNNLYEKFQKTLTDNYNKLVSSKIFDKNLNNKKDQINQSSKDEIVFSDQDLEAVTVAVMSKVYQDNKGSYIDTGYVGADRYIFNAGYGLLSMPKDIFISVTIYNILCLGQLNPKASLMKALALFTADRLIFDQLYYYTRRDAINL